jgi:possible sensor histidine kinase
MGDTQVGCFLCGQVLTEKPDEEKFRMYAKELGINEEKYIEALRKVKILPYERIEYIANFLYKISSKMSNFIYYQNIGISANEFYKNIIDEFHKQLEIDEENKIKNKNSSFKNILNKISETLKINYKIDEKELSRINKNSDDISEKSSSIIKNIQDTVKNFNTFDIS